MATGNKSLDLSIRISGKVDKSLTAAIESATKQTSSFSKNVSAIGKAGLAAMSAVAVAGIAAIGNCTNEAESWEASMANVAKYVDGLADKAGQFSDELAGTANGNTYAENYGEMSKALLDLSTQIPYTAKELSELAAAAGQSGYSIDDLIQYDSNGNIQGFLKDVAMWGTAMDISAEQAGDWAAKWEQAFKLDHSDIMVLADQINYLGANSATTAAEIAEAVNASAALGQIAGVDVSTTAALADAMLATGVSSGRVGTSIKRTYTNLSKGESATKAMKEQWEELGFTAEGVAKSMQEDSIKTLNEVFTAIGNLPKERQVAALSTLFGQWAIEGDAKIVGNMDVYTRALDMVSDPEKYQGSMEREFIIKSSTTEAIDQMMSSSVSAFKIDIGEEFLPVKKQFSLMMIDIMNGMRDHMPEITQLAGTIADLASKGVSKLGDALEKALPYIQRGLDYINNNGETVTKVIGGMAAAFAAMTFAPKVEGLIGGVGSLIFGDGNSSGGRSKGGIGGLVGTAVNLFHGGQNAGAFVQNVSQAAGIGAGLGNSVMTDTGTGGNGGILQRISNSAIGAIFGIKNRKGLTNDNSKDNAFFKVLMSTAEQITNAKESGGLLGMAKSAAANTGIGRYIGGIAGAAGQIANTSIGGGIINALKTTGSVTKEILTGIVGPEGMGITELIEGAGLLGQMGLEAIANSAPGQMIGSAGQAIGGVLGKGASMAGGAVSMAGGALSQIGSFAGAGAGLLGSVWGPAAGGFMSLFAGAAPVIAAISGIIAVVSILGDHLEDIRVIIGNTFGEKGLAIFDTFTGKLGEIGNFISGLFQDGGVAAALQPVRDAIVGLFDSDTAAMVGGAFDGVVAIIQSVMGIIGQIVTFSTGTVKPIIQDIFSYITGTVMPIIIQTFSEAAPTIAEIISSLGTAVMTGMQTIGTVIQAVLPIIESIITLMLNIGSVVIPAVLSGFEVFASGISTVMTDIQGFFDGLITFVTGVFSGNWEQAWDGIKQIFGNAFDALVELCKTPINAVIAIINGVVSKINGMGFTIPDWVPAIGGKEFTINLPTIPQLAEGGFTNGVSIAGEAGPEAVISFQDNVRNKNIDTWMQAGRILGVNGEQAAQAAGITSIQYFADGGFTDYAASTGEGSARNTVSSGIGKYIGRIQNFAGNLTNTTAGGNIINVVRTVSSIVNGKNESGTETSTTANTSLEPIINSTQVVPNIGDSLGQALQMLQVTNRSYEAPLRATDFSYFDDDYPEPIDIDMLDALRDNRMELYDIDDADMPLRDYGGREQSSGDIIFSPQIIVQGNADKDMLNQLMADLQSKFEEWYEQHKRREARIAY